MFVREGGRGRGGGGRGGEGGGEGGGGGYWGWGGSGRGGWSFLCVGGGVGGGFQKEELGGVCSAIVEERVGETEKEVRGLCERVGELEGGVEKEMGWVRGENERLGAVIGKLSETVEEMGKQLVEVREGELKEVRDEVEEVKGTHSGFQKRVDQMMGGLQQSSKDLRSHLRALQQSNRSAAQEMKEKMGEGGGGEWKGEVEGLREKVGELEEKLGELVREREADLGRWGKEREAWEKERKEWEKEREERRKREGRGEEEGGEGWEGGGGGGGEGGEEGRGIWIRCGGYVGGGVGGVCACSGGVVLFIKYVRGVGVECFFLGFFWVFCGCVFVLACCSFVLEF